MFNNNNKNSDCVFAEQGILYLYDEISVVEKSAYETHLIQCSECSDRLAGFNLAHSSILEWKNEEFSTLANPNIQIPYDYIERGSETVSAPVKARPWFFDLGKIFRQPAAWSGAFALLLVFAGVYLFFFNFTKTDELASDKSQNLALEDISPKVGDNRNIAAATNPVENESSSLNEKISVPDGSKDKEHAVEIDSKEKAKKNIAASSVSLTRFPANTAITAQVPKRAAPARRLYNSGYIAQAAASNSSGRKIPKLNQIEDDDEDNSLRLTDLLESVAGDKF